MVLSASALDELGSLLWPEGLDYLYQRIRKEHRHILRRRRGWPAHARSTLKLTRPISSVPERGSGKGAGSSQQSLKTG